MQLEQLLQQQTKAGTVSPIANPFVKGSVMRVHFYIGRWAARAPIVFQATIYVEQGSTKGEHQIEGVDYPDLMARVSAVLGALQ